MRSCAWLAICLLVVVTVSTLGPGVGPGGTFGAPRTMGEPPYEATNASAAPSPIWVDSSPPGFLPREATVTLRLDGRGEPIAEPRPQDTVFMIDASTSMWQNDPQNLRLAAAKHYVDLLNSTDAAAVVGFSLSAYLVNSHHLGSDFAQVKTDIDTLAVLHAYTDLYDPIRIATDELTSNGDADHVWVEILLTDGDDTTGHTEAQILSEAQRAADANITVFTVGLIGSGGVNEDLLREIANVTGGEYLRADDANALDGIYAKIRQMVTYPDTAGSDNTVEALLPDYIGYVYGSAAPMPDFVGVSGGETVLEWNFTKLRINETWTATFLVTSSLAGDHLDVLSYPSSQVAYTRYDGARVSAPFPETFVDVIGSLPPVADAGGPYLGWEDSPIVFSASASMDPDGDPLTFRWDFQDDGSWDTNWSLSPYANFTWGDDWTGTARVEVSDGNLTASATADVTVNNVAPTIPDLQVYAVANVTLRVAGEKWHDVRMDLAWNGNVTGSVRVVRMPGSPDRQSATIEGALVPLLGDFRIALYYTPGDDHVNGQPNGANPVWVIIAPPGEDEIRLHHTFNVQHPDTWTWTIDDLRPYLIGHRITFDATAHDVGSDDLTFAWDFGDGATATTTYFNNGVSPDPYPSPEVNPITANDVHAHAFVMAGTYTVTLAVTDDDGGTVSTVFTLQVGG